MEQTVFPAPAVAGILEGMVEARLHLDKAGMEDYLEMQQEMAGSLARPTYVIEDPRTGRYEVRMLQPSYFSAGSFAAALRSAADELTVAGTPRRADVASLESE
jgi:hypothetical protein